MIRAGDLDRRITIQRRALSRSPGYGEAVEGWSDVATVAAAVRQASGKEFLAGSVTVAEGRAVFVIRFRADVTTLDRIAYGGALFDLDDVRELGRREGLELHGKAVA